MKTVSDLLKQEFVNGIRTTIVKIITKSGTTYGYTDYDSPLIVEGQTYTPAPGLKRTTLTATTNDQVSNQELGSGWVDAPESDLIAGKFDNALVEVAFCSWQHPDYGRVIIQRGNIGVIQWSADGFRADILSHMRQLQRNINFITTANCRHQLFSQFNSSSIGACTLNASSYTYNGTVTTVSVPRLKFVVSGLSQPAQYCQNGILTWTSGPNAGLKHEVKNHTVGGSTEIELFLPTFITPAAGNTFSITAGCDKTQATCKTKFSNGVNFGGFPHIQTEVQYR
jgi:uncharacterized phage protein (TIGR02218 family)